MKGAREIVEEYIENNPEIQASMKEAKARDAANFYRWLFALVIIIGAVLYFMGENG